MSSQTPGKGEFSISDRAFIIGVASVAGFFGVIWCGAALSALAAGSPVPRKNIGQSVTNLLKDPSSPSKAWREAMPGPVGYWLATTLVASLFAAVAISAANLARRSSRKTARDPRRLPGIADRHEIKAAAGRRAVQRRGLTVRPSLRQPEPQQVGYRLGRAAGREVWASVEDSLVILGPPRSGKGLHLVIPMILDAPGPVVTTSTRPDNVVATLACRRKHGRPVAVFDPQRLAPDVEPVLRWSPIRGCEVPQTAMIRARALAAGTGRGLEGADFWQAQTEAVLRTFLHAAAIDGRPPRDLYRWSLSTAGAGEAARILNTSSLAADGWADALENAIATDPRARDSIWLGVRTALASLADPRVLDAISPRSNEVFDPADFLAASGTLYLLGTSAGAGAAANLIAAYVEDVVEVARRTAAGSPNTRLDPPLALILDEVANYPLPSLPSLMSEGGGSGITTVAVLQSLAQARAKWGDHQGSAIWDSAIVKIILGGGSNARDLADLSSLIGDRDDDVVGTAQDSYGRRSTSMTVRRVPIMDQGRLRTLPFGTGVLLLRSARPAVIDLQPWTSRPEFDARQRSDRRASAGSKENAAQDSALR